MATTQYPHPTDSHKLQPPCQQSQSNRSSLTSHLVFCLLSGYRLARLAMPETAAARPTLPFVVSSIPSIHHTYIKSPVCWLCTALASSPGVRLSCIRSQASELELMARYVHNPGHVRTATGKRCCDRALWSACPSCWTCGFSSVGRALD